MMMNGAVMRIGLIGAGFIGRTHLQAAGSVPGLEVVGIVDPMARRDHPDLAGIPFFDGVEDLVRHARPDGVIIAVPDQFHVPVATECLGLGVAVMLEKPAATSLVEAVELAGAPDVASRLLVAHQRRHHPAAQVTKDLIDRGGLGRLIGVNGVFALRKDDNYFVERPRGVGLVNLIHDLDLLQHFCGRVTVVSAVASHTGRGAREEDTLALTLEFDSGVVGTMVATDAAPSPWGWDQSTPELPSIPYTPAGTAYSLLGRDASLSVPDLRLFRHNDGEAWHHPLVESRLPTPDGNAYVNQLAHFADVIRGTARPLVGINEAINTQAALEATFLSAGEERRVRTADLVESCYEKV
jgi:predicted dehydrogenase